MTDNTMVRYPEKAPVLEAAARWRELCLIGDGSILSDEPLWTPANVDQLVRYFVENPDLSDRDFFAKLKDQLEEATPSAHRLAAEMLWVILLFPIGMHLATKLQQIRRVWAWGGTLFPEDHPELDLPLKTGIGKPGVAYHVNRWRELQFLVLWTRDIKTMPQADRSALFRDPWAFAEKLEANEYAAGRMLRHVLLFLLFPDAFEPIAAPEPKRLILRRLGNESETASLDYKDRVAVDRALLRLRDRLEGERGLSVNFYAPDVHKLWKDKASDGPDEDDGATDLRRQRVFGTAEDVAWAKDRFGGHNVWLVAAGDGGHQWQTFQSEGVVSIGWDELGDLSRYGSRDAISADLVKLYGSGRIPMNDSLACWQFSHEMQPGDVVIAKQGRRQLLGYGTVRSAYRHESGRQSHRNVRSVDWDRTGPWTLAEDRRFALKAVTLFTAYADWLHHAFGVMDREPGEEPARDLPEYSIDDALTDLFMPRDTFERILDALERKKNVILEGPPGVGKSFVARRVAWTLIGSKDPSRVLMIQFHQSYSYEDFVQGWRPAAGGGFELRNGVFHQFCKRAEVDPKRRYVFIIDEINRGNLSRIFGELMLLVESDKRGPEWSVPLTYARTVQDQFSVPANIFLLGLMNTADRSLALVDYALRRRFGFVRLEPCFDQDSFTAQFEGLAEAELIGRIVARMTAVNERIREDRRNLGRGFEIGHSFFVPAGDEDVDFGWYERVIRTEIEPLLREYWFDKQEEVDRVVSELLRE